ncbi:MAG: SDR family NAD(P)-dependent oxidoreductase [Bacteroidales bacterium]
MMKRLNEKTAVITGGAGALGKSTAKRFLDEGASVMLVDLKEDDLKTAVEELGGDRAYYAVADVSKVDDVQNYADAARQHFDKVDIFFNNAGIEGVVKPITEYPVEEFDKVIAVNIRGVWLGMKYMIPLMKKGGSIIISSSVAGLRGTANVSAYVASKHALVGIMRTCALELAGNGIRVNTINPSPVDNRMMRSLEKGFNPDESEEAKKQFEQMIPMGRYAANEDIASLVTFLAGDESRFITGTVNLADGGMTAK